MTPVTPAPPSRGSVIGVLRDGAWLTAERARAYGWILLWTTIAIGAAWVLFSRAGLDPSGKPLGADFTSFWSASRLALGGAPAGAYDMPVHHAQEVMVVGRDTGYAAFFYPPIFLLVCLPLATLPYLASLAVWLALTGVAYWRMARAWLGEAFGAMPIFAFPAVFTNIGHGQNGFLSAALFGGGALWLERRPILAGVCLGALAYKPHLGLLIPFALAIAGRWKSFAAAAATVIALAAASLGLFGPDAWRGFIADSGLARLALEQGLVGNAKMQSAFAAVRLWGGGLALAYAAQTGVAVFAMGGLVWLRRRAPGSAAEGPAMIVAAVLTSPFLLDYDLVILAAPLAWMLREGARKGFLNWEKTTLAAAFALPLVSRTLATQAHLPLAPLVMVMLFLLVLKRAGHDAAAVRADDAPRVM